MKAPAFQFYVADFMRDTRCLSLAAKGAWIDCLCAMWSAQNRGSITYPVIGFARLFGCSAEQAVAVIDELVEMQICDRVTHDDGKMTVVSRRMTREAKARKQANNRQKTYVENKRRKNDGVNDAKDDAQMTHPSSSSLPETSSMSQDGEPPSSEPPIPAKEVAVERRIWKDGVDLVAQSGFNDKNARSYLGKLAKTYGKSNLAQAIAICQSENPADPAEFLSGILKERYANNPRSGGTGKDADREAAARARAELNRAIDDELAAAGIVQSGGV